MPSLFINVDTGISPIEYRRVTRLSSLWPSITKSAQDNSTHTQLFELVERSWELGLILRADFFELFRC